MSSLITAEKVTNMFLYGQASKPTNMADENLIRPINSQTLEISVNGDDFMSIGPGRFAMPVLWQVVKEFFNLNVGLPPNTPAKPYYTEQEIRTMTGVGNDDATKTLHQYNFDDGLDNYAERVYIWNSGQYEIDDSAQFVVDENGNRHIEHLAVIPLGPQNQFGSHGGKLDNFDFEGGDIFTNALNVTLESLVDPSGIGQKINLEMTNVTAFRSYSIADFVADITKQNSAYISTASAFTKLANEGLTLVNQLFDGGSTRFLDADNKPILYGSDNGDLILGTLSREHQSGTHIDIAPGIKSYGISGYIQNGITYIGGDGSDTLIGTDKADKFYGNNGNDRLSGGSGFDTYYAGNGDTLNDTDGKGKVLLNNQELQGGTFVSAEKAFKDTAGNSYAYVGNNLSISNSTKTATITIENFHNNDLGINLRYPSTGQSGAISWREITVPTNATVTDGINNSWNGAQRTTATRVDPLTLDLDGDGLETSGFNAAQPVYFDHDVNGIKEGTGWVLPDDGLLVLDRNGNGLIDNGTELFGDHTPLTTGGNAVDGFAALVPQDTNLNGSIDAGDINFNNFRIWRDLNQDGISQPNELTTLINLTQIAHSQALREAVKVVKARHLFEIPDFGG